MEAINAFVPVCCAACGIRIGCTHIMEQYPDIYCMFCIEDFANFVESFALMGESFTGQLLLCINQIISRHQRRQYYWLDEKLREITDQNLLDKLSAP